YGVLAGDNGFGECSHPTYFANADRCRWWRGRDPELTSPKEEEKHRYPNHNQAANRPASPGRQLKTGPGWLGRTSWVLGRSGGIGRGRGRGSGSLRGSRRLVRPGVGLWGCLHMILFYPTKPG